jgi:hypothetical protein
MPPGPRVPLPVRGRKLYHECHISGTMSAIYQAQLTSSSMTRTTHPVVL